MSVSIIIPARNEELNIRQCLTSLLNQKVKSEKIVIVLDRCTDKTEKIIDEFIANDSTIIKIVKNHSKYNKSIHKGFIIAEVINVGLKSLDNSSEFIMICNADSIYSENYIEETINVFRDNDDCVIVGYTDYHAVSGSGYTIKTEFLQKIGGQIKECAAEDTYIQFTALRYGYSIKPIKNISITFQRKRGEGKISDKIKYMFSKGYAGYTLGFSFYYEILKVGYWILKGKFTAIGIIVGFVYSYLSHKEKLDIAYTDIPKIWQKQRIKETFK